MRKWIVIVDVLILTLIVIALLYLRNFDFPNIHTKDTQKTNETNEPKSPYTILDLFNGTQLNQEIWYAVDRSFSYNNELQAYTSKNVIVKEGVLQLIGKKETYQEKNYTSGYVTSRFCFRYGTIDYVISLPKGKGLFSALWLLPLSSTSNLPEVDLLEVLGHQPDVFYGVRHYNKNGKRVADFYEKSFPLKDEYRITLEWKPDSLIWYVDNQFVFKTVVGVPNDYMYLNMNLAIGGNWPGSPDAATRFPQAFVIKEFKLVTNELITREYYDL